MTEFLAVILFIIIVKQRGTSCKIILRANRLQKIENCCFCNYNSRWGNFFLSFTDDLINVKDKWIFNFGCLSHISWCSMSKLVSTCTSVQGGIIFIGNSIPQKVVGQKSLNYFPWWKYHYSFGHSPCSRVKI